MFLPLLLSRLPELYRISWADILAKKMNTHPSFKPKIIHLIQFLSRRVATEESAEGILNQTKVQKSDVALYSIQTTSKSHQKRTNYTCNFCKKPSKGFHRFSCPALVKLSLNERKKLANEKKFCTICLFKSHQAPDCRVKNIPSCKKCNVPHSELFCEK